MNPCAGLRLGDQSKHTRRDRNNEETDGGLARKVDGGFRYAMDTPSIASERREDARENPALAEALRPALIVDESPDGRLTIVQWLGTGSPPGWDEIRESIEDEERERQ